MLTSDKAIDNVISGRGDPGSTVTLSLTFRNHAMGEQASVGAPSTRQGHM